MSKSKRYWIWITGKPGVPPHKLIEEIAKHDELQYGRGVQTWTTAMAYVRDAVRLGFMVTIYQEED